MQQRDRLLPADASGRVVAGRLLGIAEAGQGGRDAQLLPGLPVDRQHLHVGGDGPPGIAEGEADEGERVEGVGRQQALAGFAADVQRPVAVPQR
ncbi:MAG TPA: hypothetical protein VH478_06055 [Trebonia sp.]|nr:hypothetical protein [Trebonia sp.]